MLSCIRWRTLYWLGWLCSLPALALAEGQTFDLQMLLDKAVAENPTIAVSKAQTAAAAAGVTVSRSYYNPDLEIMAGPARYRNAPGTTNQNYGVTISQPLDFLSTRASRREYAEQQFNYAEKGIHTTSFDLRNQIKAAYLNVLLRQQIMEMLGANLALLQQVQSRVKRKVEIGEAARYELIKADTELLATERDYASAQTRIDEAKAMLHGMIGNMPDAFEIKRQLPTISNLPDITELRRSAENNPYLQQLQSARDSAEAKLKLEQALRFPGVTVKSDFTQDPDLNTLRVGVVVPLPVWNRREGQIAQAVAGIEEANANIKQQQLLLRKEIDSAYQRTVIASNQLKAFENGLLQQSQATLSRAEAAYKFGERGILEYLDAQRVNREVKRDYLIAKFDYFFSVLQIERFIGSDLVQP
ncbi:MULTISPECIES: TolC family protein [unclassified Methylophilus]|jgi:outer membrane protein, heavy metal efflux system|uniref:TolC family protein n=1 Tax=Methylophilus glucosoxydans TaxID=752553 RepID=A0ABW3GFM1_9PROT|nr:MULTISPECIES: TolC family protein [unclassified Methylophilus]MBF5039529.1 TolC family protein [Methylophilus sp. 13]MDF0377726.1 TolC family protein [Methylophilus sp. YYY-1]MDT7849102.1 TolC family protein [Methylophilus sp. VKM B-3414]BEV08953.1 TolC family protein [Methylophilus sp. DW102]